MRLHLAAMAALAASCVLGSSNGASFTFFEDDVPAHEWSASKHKHLRARALAANVTSGSDPLTPRLRNATEADLRQARLIVEQAVEKAAALNRKRLENPLRNNYGLQEGTRVFIRDETSAPPLLDITDEIAAAAALVAEADAIDENPDVNSSSADFGIKEARQGGGFWMESIQRRGSWPWGDNSADFKVFRNVKDYGAKGDGKTDDTKAIRKAIEDGGSMCGDGCYSSTKRGAIIYFPSGTYLVSSTIEKHYGTQLVGNPNNRPIMKASRLFVGLGIFSTNKYYGDGKEDEAKQDHAWHINTGIFWGQIRNFVIDISGAYKKILMTGLHYQVSQATSLQYVDFIASTDADAEQRAIFAENGSGGHMSDLTFTGGKFGIYGGNQQFTAQRITFKNVRVPAQLIWDWGWTWKSIVVDGAKTAFKFISEDSSHGIGGALIVDSVIKNTEVAVAIYSPTQELGKGTTGLTIDNVKFENVGVLVNEMSSSASSARNTTIAGGSRSIDLWVLGRSYQNNTLGTDMIQETVSPRLAGLTDRNNPHGLKKDPYFERPKPQYEQNSAGDFVSTKASCKGDGVTDDTRCLQDVINGAAGNKIVHVDAGTYILTDTLFIPPGSKIVGENWAQLAATGSKFADEERPVPMIRVGNEGQKGVAELQDLIFTSKGETAGAIFVEWNIEAEDAGKAGIWDCHIRVGGTDGSGLTSRECPPARSGVSPGCKGGSMLMHLTPSGSGYFENAWLWVADHDLDDPDWKDNNNKMTQTSIYVARGLLIESRKPTWLYGTSSEHSVYYQYQFYKAANVLAGMIQTEQPYYQPTPKAPAPFEKAVGVFSGDPGFPCTKAEPCDSGWGLRILESRDITVLGAGLYSWFSTYSQDCLATSSCQETMAHFERNSGAIVIHNLVTIGATNMISTDGDLITAKDNQAVDFHPYWSQLSRFEARETGPVDIPALPSKDGNKYEEEIERIEADLNKECKRFPECVNMDNPLVSSCDSGWTSMGYDESGCGTRDGQKYGKPICCRTKVAPKFCVWRKNQSLGGIASDCNGRCNTGEVFLFDSGTGGYPTDSDEAQCGRGYKAFCCTSNSFKTITSGCEWTPFGTCSDQAARPCPAGKSVLTTQVSSPLSNCFLRSNYCCPDNKPKPLSNCHWVGQGDCGDNSCNNREVTLHTSSYGDTLPGCGWGRHKSLCCTPVINKEGSARTCPRPFCETHPFECPADIYADDASTEPDPEDFNYPQWKRSLDTAGSEFAFADANVTALAAVEERALLSRQSGEKRPYRVFFAEQVAGRIVVRILELLSRAYNGPTAQMRARDPNVSQNGYRRNPNDCDSNEIQQFDVRSTLGTTYTGYEVDHTLELQYLQDFAYAAVNGRTLSDNIINNPIPFDEMEAYWMDGQRALPPASRKVTPSTRANFDGLNSRLYEAIGSKTNRAPFRFLSHDLNNIKGRIFNMQYNARTGGKGGPTNPRADDYMEAELAATFDDATGSLEEAQGFLGALRDVVAVFRYLHDPDVLDAIQRTRWRLREQCRVAENDLPKNSKGRSPLLGLTAILEAFDDDYWDFYAANALRWINRWLDTADQMMTNFQRRQNREHPDQLFILAAMMDILRDAEQYVRALPARPTKEP